MNHNSNNEKENEIITKGIFNIMKNDYFLQKLFHYLQKKKYLEIIKYNNNIKKRTKININDYKEYSENYSSIELEIIPNGSYFKFINIEKEEDEIYYHIYFNDEKKEVKGNYIDINDGVEKIKIKIDYQIKSLSRLFFDCKRNESIYFKKFCRNNITDMSWMFYGCSSLKELNLNNFNTNNVTDMSFMFDGCSSLKELNLNSFNTKNVTNIERMFGRCYSLTELNINNFITNNVINMRSTFWACSSLKEINLNNFKTDNVTDMYEMFDGCSSLKELNLNNFNTNKVHMMCKMFSRCSSLEELNLDNFNTDKVDNMRYMFNGCSEELKNKIRAKYKNINEEALKNFDFSWGKL